MKKLAVLTVMMVLLALLCSCEKEQERVFDYQEGLKSVTGVFTEGGEEYGVVLYFENAESGIGVRRIEYTSPESVAGLSFALEGESITAELSGVRIANSYFDKEKVFRQEKLFCLSEEDIYDIKSEKGGKVAIYGKNESEAWTVITDSDGDPEKITFETAENSMTFEVKKTVH